MMVASERRFRVLFLCSGNSARSQLAEALLNWKGKGRLDAHSAGISPAAQVNPYALRELEQRGIPWSGHVPRSLEGLEKEDWDFVITVCDQAKESCPLFPGRPVLAHWGMPDPASAQGSEDDKRAAFKKAALTINRRLDLFVSLPLEKLVRLALQGSTQAIGKPEP
jgi:protein-tyrosine-phosphatase